MDTLKAYKYSGSCVIVLLCFAILVASKESESGKGPKSNGGAKGPKSNGTLAIIASGIANTLRRISLSSKAKKASSSSSRGHGWDDYYDYYPPPPPPIDSFGPMLLMTLIPIMLMSSFVPALTMFTANSFGLIQNQGINSIPGNTIATGRRRRKRGVFGPYTRHFRTLSEEVVLVILRRLQEALEKHGQLRTARRLV